MGKSMGAAQGPFTSLPGLEALDSIVVDTERRAGAATAHLVSTGADVPTELGFDREALAAAGFEAQAGQTLVIPRPEGGPLIMVGVGDDKQPSLASLRDAAAAAARASKNATALRIVAPRGAEDTEASAQAVIEGAILARYRYVILKKDPKHTPLGALSIDMEGADADLVERARSAAIVSSRAAIVARDLANTPPGHLTASDLGTVAQQLGTRFGFDVEVFDKKALKELGCGGLLGVNQGSAEEPRMIKLTYSPAAKAAHHVGLVGKGIMYDSGGISLKPSDPMHLLMKMDMAGAAAVLGAFTALRDRSVASRVTAWLMCTDNMPSGSALKLGDVLTARGGTTIEIKNTDAEGRLVMCDALALATEEGVDMLVDIATLTGAALMALGTATAAFFANDDRLAEDVAAAAARVDEPVWRMPLERKYRSQLDSDIADIANLGGKYAGATTAALFLSHFVGDTPWAHIDIAGTMNAEKDDAWRSTGATGYGARLLLELAANSSH
jgi:leucyl aminopeptidase